MLHMYTMGYIFSTIYIKHSFYFMYDTWVFFVKLCNFHSLLMSKLQQQLSQYKFDKI